MSEDQEEVVKTLAIAAVALVASGSAVKVTISAPTHRPRINVRWHYVVRATRDGRPITARITVQVVDPIGGVHPVQFGSSTKSITRFRFRGVFRDYIIWPPESRGFTLKVRAIVVGKGVRKVVLYAVTPHA
jgi:hypothetical protein